MAHDEHPNPNPQDDPSSAPVAYVTLLTSLIVVVMIIGAAALAYQFESRFGDERAAGNQGLGSEALLTVSELNASQQAALHAPAQIDTENGTATIPIDDAMEQVRKELARAKGAMRQDSAVGG